MEHDTKRRKNHDEFKKGYLRYFYIHPKFWTFTAQFPLLVPGTSYSIWGGSIWDLRDSMWEIHVYYMGSNNIGCMWWMPDTSRIGPQHAPVLVVRIDWGFYPRCSTWILGRLYIILSYETIWVFFGSGVASAAFHRYSPYYLHSTCYDLSGV